MKYFALLIATCILILTGCTPATTPSVVGAEAYCQETVHILDAVQADMPEIQRTASLAAGCYCDKWRDMGLSADGSGVFCSEITGRSGSVMALGSGRTGEKGYRGVVLYCLQGRDHLAGDLAKIAGYNERGCKVFLFGSKDLLERAQLSGAKCEAVIEIPNASVAGVSTYDLASVCVVWPWMCEFVSACTRQGQMPVMFLSIFVPGGMDRIAKNTLKPSETGDQSLRKNPEVLKAVENDSTLKSLRTYKDQLESELPNLRRKFGPDHRQARDMENKLTEVNRQIEKTTQEVIDQVAKLYTPACLRTYRKFESTAPKAIPAGQLGNEWLTMARANLAAVYEHDMPAIRKAAQMASAAKRGGHSAYLRTNGHADGHLFGSAFNPTNFIDANGMPKDKKIAKGDMVLGLAYNSIFAMPGEIEFVKMSRASGAACVWSASAPAAAGDPKTVATLPGEVFIDQHWAYGDADVTVPGYDAKIGPTSGAVELEIYLMTNAEMNVLSDAQVEKDD